jgi:hypothetical protein
LCWSHAFSIAELSKNERDCKKTNNRYHGNVIVSFLDRNARPGQANATNAQ